MTILTLAEAAQLIPGAQVIGDSSIRFARISTDTRSIGPGDLFVALRGKRSDGHDFLDAALANQACAALVSRMPDHQLPCILVPETRAAFSAFALAWRQRFDLPVVAVTGSNGKTTVKEMLASIFAMAVGQAAYLATQGNLNNVTGVPLTLSRLSKQHALAVLELGISALGETAFLAGLIQPTVVVVNNAQREHQEFLLSVERVALEHASAIHALSADGTAVFAADDSYMPMWRAAAHHQRVIDFVLHPDSKRQGAVKAAVTGVRLQDDPHALHIETPKGGFDVSLNISGRHNLHNALAATAAAFAVDLPLAAIQHGLQAFQPVIGRLQSKRVSMPPLAGATILDDSYNANPDSMRAAIDVLASVPSPRVLIVGDMGEMGEQEMLAHREIGAYARERGIDALYALGDASRYACETFGPQAQHFVSPQTLVSALLGSGFCAKTTFLVKGSRFMAMERIVEELVASPA